MIYLCSRVLTCLQQREVADLHSLVFMHRGARRWLYLMSKQQRRDENDESEAPVSTEGSLCSWLHSKAPQKK